MGYIGATPSNNFITTDSQRVTSSTNNYVDLDNSISSLNDVIVWVNSVKQDSTNLTLTTSTRITLGGTLTASDVVEIAYLGKAVATQTPDTGTVTNDMLAGSIANSKLANSSITLNGDSVSLGGSATVDNTPIFAVTRSGTQSISNNSHTVIQWNSEIFDPDNTFDSTTNYRFTPAVSGYYMLMAQARIGVQADATKLSVVIRKNGSAIARSIDTNKDNNTVNATTLVLSDTDDYFDVEFYQNTGATRDLSDSTENTFFAGFKIIT